MSFFGRVGFTTKRIPKVPMAKDVPSFPNIKWIEKTSSTATGLFTQETINAAKEKIFKEFKYGPFNLNASGKQPVPLRSRNTPTVNNFDVNPYLKVYGDGKRPEAASYWNDDEYFAFLRVGGYNPTMLRKVTAVDAKWNSELTAQFSKIPNFTGDNLTAAINEGRIYVVDYADLVGVVPGETKFGDKMYKKKTFAPIGIFGVSKNAAGEDNKFGRTLRPIAVQEGQSPTDRISFPQSGDYWMRARFIFNSADANYHELVSHLARTHLLMEPFVVAGKNYHGKLKYLFDAHLEGTDFINQAAALLLVKEGEPFDDLMAGSIDQNELAVSLKGLQEPGFNALMPYTRFGSNGTLPGKTDIYYPFRDDALALWDMTLEWMTANVNQFYKTDADVQNEQELKEFAEDLADGKRGDIRGFGENGTIYIQTKKYLAEVLTMMAFTAGCQHAAVNFAQKGIMTFVPNAPTALFETNDPLDLNGLLGPEGHSSLQYQVASLLGGVHYTEYGHYDDGVPPALAVANKTFKTKLAAYEKKINDRNAEVKGKFKYEYLIPSSIPQSINI